MSRFPQAFALLLVAPCLMGVERPDGLGDVSDVRTWSHPNYTRVVVELTRPVDAEVLRLPADARAKRPERLYVDLPKIWVGRRYQDPIPVGDGLLQGVRLGQNTLSKSRLVVDLERYDRHRLLILQSPHRVVIDVYGSRGRERTTTRFDAPPGEVPPPRSRLSMGMRPVHTIVIDAGHGGRDPGAIGVGGLREKNVNLRLARRLAGELEGRNFRVVMTRSDDRTLDLEQRTVIAESAGGDVFVSIHANASRRRGTRGLEIYYLDENYDGHSLDVAARENGVPRSQIDSLQRTIARLRVSEASAHSGRLAELVHGSLWPGLGKRYRGLADLGVKRGPFYVLFLSSMPAILVETGFLTNKEDARLLRNDDYLALLAKNIASGLDRYRLDGTRVALGVDR